MQRSVTAPKLISEDSDSDTPPITEPSYSLYGSSGIWGFSISSTDLAKTSSSSALGSSIWTTKEFVPKQTTPAGLVPSSSKTSWGDDTPSRLFGSHPMLFSKSAGDPELLPKIKSVISKPDRTFKSAVISKSSSGNSLASISKSDEVDLFLSNKYVNDEVDEIIIGLMPCPESERLLSTILRFVEALVRKSLGAKLFAHGSFALKTYLPDSDLNIAAFFTHNHHRTWIQRTIKSLLREDFASAVASSVQFSPGSGTLELADYLVVKNSNFEASPYLGKVVHALVGNVTVEICANQPNTLSSVALFEELDRLVGKDHLFKRTIILTKAWACYEAEVLGQSDSFLNSYCIHIMVFFVFNAFYREIETPLQALWKLLEYLSRFDWSHMAFGVFGPVLVSKLPEIQLPSEGPSSWPKGIEPLISEAVVARYRDISRGPASETSLSSWGSSSSLSEGMPVPLPKLSSGDADFIYVMDPRDPSSNVVSYLSGSKATAIKIAFLNSTRSFRRFISEWMSTRQSKKVVHDIFHGSCLRIETIPKERRNLSPVLPGPDAYRILDGNLAAMVQHIVNASEFDVPDISEEELVDLMKTILEENGGVVTVGKMGSLMHAATNNHSLPATLKVKYGGLKKLLRRHSHVFYIASDHPHNPRVYLRDPSVDYSSLISPDPTPVSHLSPGPIPIPMEGTTTSVLRPMLTSGSSSSLSSSPSHSPKFYPPGVLPYNAVIGSRPLLSDIPIEDEKELDLLTAESELVIPPVFMCPLSKRPMLDPVVLSTGITFDRRSIEDWRSRHGNVCPLTGSPLDLSLTFPNESLRSMISQFFSGKLKIQLA